MEVLLLAAVIVGWILSAAMVAAVLSDLSKPTTNRRGRIVLGGALLLTVGLLLVEGIIKSINALGEAVLILSFTFGVAAMIVYTGFLVVSAACRVLKSRPKNDIAV